MLSESGKVIPPAEFLPIAEEFSLTGQLDRWVVDQALDLARREPLTVNLSAHSIGDPGILAAVTKAIATGLDPTNLIFEITETAVVTDFNRALTFVLDLGELGFDLALDDFGTGFGSFDYLKNLPARYVKIDMEFVCEINEAPVNKEIVRSIVEIARSLEKMTIAEGVENEDVMETLLTLGVDYGQGWYFGAPQPHTQTVVARAPQAS
jgi:EAL domain-containing protein (putative c-di-GMP-specific phosphodiesterase class I)